VRWEGGSKAEWDGSSELGVGWGRAAHDADRQRGFRPTACDVAQVSGAGSG
jgi:hypothetical protein